MEEEVVKILLVDDDEDDFIITRGHLEEIRGSRCEVDWISDFDSALERLASDQYDVYLIDYRLGTRNGLDLLRAAGRRGSWKPMILLTGQGDREIDYEAMRAGAADYLVKDRIDAPTLERSIRYALRHSRTLEVLDRAVHENSLLASAINDLATGVAITDATSDESPIVFVNPAFTRLTGFPADEVIGRSWEFLFGDYSRDQVEGIARLVSAGETVTMLLYGKRKDQTGFWSELTLNPIADEDGAVVNFVMLQNDVTQKQISEQELRASEERFRSVIESAPDAIVLTDSRLRVVHWNRGAERIFDYSREEFVGSRVSELIATEHRADFEESIARLQRLTAEERVVRSSGLRAVRKTGGQFPVEISMVSWSAAGADFYSIIFRDITERIIAQKMRLAKEAAEEANRAKSEFLARMSHELRTPLNSVIGFASILLKNRDGAFSEQDMACLEKILDNGKHLLSLINEILDLSRVEAGRMEVDLSTFSLADLVSETLGQLESQARPGVVLRRNLPPHLKPLTSDIVKVRQILFNLIGNGLKFTKEGFVEVRVKADREGVPQRIDVQDSGIGIPEGQLDGVLEPFQQIDNTSSRRYDGTGLGLTISRSLCQLLGFDMKIQSKIGVGSTFSVILSSEE